MRLFALCLALVFTLMLVGCGSNDNPSPAVENNERTVGDSAVIARIENSTSCTDLQREFDIAMDNAEAHASGDPARDLSLTYANAANNRMREIGCYG